VGYQNSQALCQGVRFIFLQGLPLWIGQRETASKDDWQQDGEGLERLPPELQLAGLREQGRVQTEGAELAAGTTATDS